MFLIPCLVAAIYNNFGNLELATGNPKWAMEHYERALQIWKDGGEETADQLALTQLCIARVHTLRNNIPEALRFTGFAKMLFSRTTGADKGFMAKYTPGISVIRCDKADDLTAASITRTATSICRKETGDSPGSPTMSA
jgi:hypothetical protein